MRKQWIVAYVKSRFEKKIADLLTKLGYEFYLPLQKELRQWKDRKKWIEKPLFPGYLFLNINSSDYYNVLNINGIVKFIEFGGKPIMVSDETIVSISKSLNFTSVDVVDFQPIIGNEITIKNGPLKGIKGKLVEVKGNKRIGIEIECMNKLVLVNIGGFNIL